MPTSDSPANIASWTEWDLLKEVIVGTVRGAYVPDEPLSMIQATMPESQWDFYKARAGQPFPADEIEAAERDLSEFVRILTNEGVKVRRPDDPGSIFREPIKGDGWIAKSGLYAAMPRDNLLPVGKKLIEVPMAWRSRQNEGVPYQSLLKQYSERGVDWIKAPKPKLKEELFTKSWDPNVDSFHSVITEVEPTFDAADFLRFGADIIGQESHVTNKAGIRWLQETLGQDSRVHIIQFADIHPMHIDATLLPLRPGLALVNPERVPPDLRKTLQNGLFKGWEFIDTPAPSIPADYRLYMTSRWINMNILSIDTERVVIEENDLALERLLKNHGFKVLKCPFRNFNRFGGSFHCATCDVWREGPSQQRYLSS